MLKKDNLQFYKPDFENSLAAPFIPSGIKAGFPSPAADFIDVSIDLNKHLI